jgi:hypothetical protein
MSSDVQASFIRASSLRKARFGIDLRTLRLALIVAYLVGYVWWFFERGIIIDRISVLLSVAGFFAVASVGLPPRQVVRNAGDLSLFVVMWLAYDESRGIADSIGMPVQIESVRDLDRLLFFGTDPVVWLQYRFYEGASSVRWYDVAGSMIYYSHFIVPPVVIVALWFINRDQWVRYMRRFATLLFVACASFVLLPTAPPWMAAGGRNQLGLELEALPELRRPTGNGWRHIGLDGFVRVLLATLPEQLVACRVAAVPAGDGRGARLLRRALHRRCPRRVGGRRRLVLHVEQDRGPPTADPR